MWDRNIPPPFRIRRLQWLIIPNWVTSWILPSWVTAFPRSPRPRRTRYLAWYKLWYHLTRTHWVEHILSQCEIVTSFNSFISNFEIRKTSLVKHMVVTCQPNLLCIILLFHGNYKLFLWNREFLQLFPKSQLNSPKSPQLVYEIMYIYIYMNYLFDLSILKENVNSIQFRRLFFFVI